MARYALQTCRLPYRHRFFPAHVQRSAGCLLQAPHRASYPMPTQPAGRGGKERTATAQTTIRRAISGRQLSPVERRTLNDGTSWHYTSRNWASWVLALCSLAYSSLHCKAAFSYRFTICVEVCGVLMFQSVYRCLFLRKRVQIRSEWCGILYPFIPVKTGKPSRFERAGLWGVRYLTSVSVVELLLTESVSASEMSQSEYPIAEASSSPYLTSSLPPILG